jgi:hypothetical protein
MKTTTITLRARHLADPLAVGDLVSRPGSETIYRVVNATKVRVSGEAGKDHWRLVLERLQVQQIPVGAEDVRPWPRDQRAPRQRRSARSRASADPSPPEDAIARIARIRSKAPLFLGMAIEAIRRGRIADEMAQLARVARVGRDDGLREGRDYGPGIRLRGVRARRQSVLLREADVEVTAGPDPARPNVTLTRARRCDPLVKLHKAGSIAGRHVDAAEKLRQQLEYAEAGGGGGDLSEIHVPAHQRRGISDWQLLNLTHVRNAVSAVTHDNRPMLLWAVSGGNVAGYAAFVGIRHNTASERLRAGLSELADHYQLPGAESV